MFRFPPNETRRIPSCCIDGDTFFFFFFNTTRLVLLTGNETEGFPHRAVGPRRVRGYRRNPIRKRRPSRMRGNNADPYYSFSSFFSSAYSLPLYPSFPPPAPVQFSRRDQSSLLRYYIHIYISTQLHARAAPPGIRGSSKTPPRRRVLTLRRATLANRWQRQVAFSRPSRIPTAARFRDRTASVSSSAPHVETSASRRFSPSAKSIKCARVRNTLRRAPLTPFVRVRPYTYVHMYVCIHVRMYMYGVYILGTPARLLRISPSSAIARAFFFFPSNRPGTLSPWQRTPRTYAYGVYTRVQAYSADSLVRVLPGVVVVYMDFFRPFPV